MQPGSVLFFQICQDSQLENMPNTDSRNIWRRVIQHIQTSEHKNVYFLEIFYGVLLLEYFLKATIQSKCRSLLKDPFLSRKKLKLISSRSQSALWLEDPRQTVLSSCSHFVMHHKWHRLDSFVWGFCCLWLTQKYLALVCDLLSLQKAEEKRRGSLSAIIRIQENLIWG